MNVAPRSCLENTRVSDRRGRTTWARLARGLIPEDVTLASCQADIDVRAAIARGARGDSEPPQRVSAEGAGVTMVMVRTRAGWKLGDFEVEGIPASSPEYDCADGLLKAPVPRP